MSETKAYEAMNAETTAPVGCPVCGGIDHSVFWETCGLPLRCNVLCATREEALHVPRGDLRLAVCGQCAHIWNVAFDPKRMTYDASYENSLHFSPRFQSYAQELADRLIREYDLRGKRIIEIACGSGDFLRLLCADGKNEGLGFDPSYQSSGDEHRLPRNVSIVADYYDERYSDRQADLICCRHALEHISTPVGFLEQVRRAIGDRQTRVFFEVPNVLYTLRDLGIWDLIYEHCGYFSSGSLGECFRRAGFSVDAVKEAFQGQFLTVDARPGASDEHARFASEIDSSGVKELAGRFRQRFEHKLDDWKQQFSALRAAGRRIVIWGAGSKGVTVLNMLGGVSNIDAADYVVDINPRKQGRFIAGTGVPIVAPECLADIRPDVVVVMNAVYQEEIRDELSRLGVEAEVMLA